MISSRLIFTLSLRFWHLVYYFYIIRKVSNSYIVPLSVFIHMYVVCVILMCPTVLEWEGQVL